VIAPPRTLVELYHRRIQASPSAVAFWRRSLDGDLPVTWAEFARDVRRTAAALARQGLSPGDRLAHVCENRYEWLVVDVAAQLCCSPHVAIHAVLSGPQIAYQINDSGAKLLIVSTPDIAARLSAVRESLPAGLVVLAHEPNARWEGSGEFPILADLANAEDEAAGQALEAQSLERTQPDDLATLLYTSGTTGEPKGVMLSHSNLTTNALAMTQAFEITPADLRLCWLPLSHIFARTCDFYTWLAHGYQLALAGSRETILADCARLKPTILSGVPYFFEKLHCRLAEAGKLDTPGALQSMLGGRMRALGSGGAALPDYLAEYFFSQEVPLLQGYGLTESSPVITASSPSGYRIGYSGRAVDGVEIRIAEDGEIITRGPHIMVGYWKLPEATAAAVRDGWLHTGDLGEIDADGYLKITGRKKELIVTSAGKNVAPVYLEALLTADPLIAQAVVLGDGRSHLAALIVPDFAQLDQTLLLRGLAAALPDRLDDAEVKAIVAERITARLAGVADCEQVRRFTLLAQPFTIESGELTPTLKVRRDIIGRQHADLIERMYAAPPSAVCAAAAPS
jgi:long-chain acyl-CoA synthetase